MKGFEWWMIRQKTHREALQILKKKSEVKPWCGYFLGDPPLNPGNLNSRCRIGYVPFEDCVQDRYYYVDKSRDPEILASGGISTQISWDGDPVHLPEGWQGAVRRSYEDSKSGAKPNTMVALLAFTPQRFRGRGFSSVMLSKMKSEAKRQGFRALIVPALPPAQFEQDKVRLTMAELADLKRDDGSIYDYWIRVHSQLEATVIGHCDTSHRFILTLKDFHTFVSSTPIPSTGEHVVTLDKDHVLGPNAKNMWQLVYADLERDFVTFDWGCVWVRYDIV